MLNMFKDEKGGEKEGVGDEEKKKGEKKRRVFAKNSTENSNPKFSKQTIDQKKKKKSYN